MMVDQGNVGGAPADVGIQSPANKANSGEVAAKVSDGVPMTVVLDVPVPVIQSSVCVLPAAVVEKPKPVFRAQSLFCLHQVLRSPLSVCGLLQVLRSPSSDPSSSKTLQQF